MNARLEFGIMLERSDTFCAPRPVWRVYSGKVHGPFMFSRLSALWAWIGFRLEVAVWGENPK